MWIFQDFSVTQILREVKFWDSRGAETAVFIILRAVKIVNVVNLSLLKVQKFINIKIQSL